MPESTESVVENAIVRLIKRSCEPGATEDQAVRFSQAAVNVANASAVLMNIRLVGMPEAKLK